MGYDGVDICLTGNLMNCCKCNIRGCIQKNSKCHVNVVSDACTLETWFTYSIKEFYPIDWLVVVLNLTQKFYRADIYNGFVQAFFSGFFKCIVLTERICTSYFIATYILIYFYERFLPNTTLLLKQGASNNSF